MSNSVLLLIMGMSSLILVPPVNMMPVQSDSSNTSNISNTAVTNSEHHFSLSRYTAMLHQLVGAAQTIQILLAEHVRIVLS